MARHIDAPTPSRRELFLGLMVLSILGGIVVARGGQPRVTEASTASIAPASPQVTETARGEGPSATPKRPLTTASVNLSDRGD